MSLLVRAVTGPPSATVGGTVTYAVTEFNQPGVSAAEAAAVSWLVKTADGAALAHLPGHGPRLELQVPATWAGTCVLVMPYMSSPSAAFAVRTEVPRTAALPPPAGTTVAVRRDGRRLYAALGGEPEFFLGSDVAYSGRRGLMNSSNPPGPRYRPEDYEARHGHWAWYLAPTITCESRGFFTCLNTYDRAAFTFGHIQLAAHTPNDNFVLLLRELLTLPLAGVYFADLALSGGRVNRRTATGLAPLEDDGSTAPLMAYLNPTPDVVDAEEAERAARMVHWCLADSACRTRIADFTVAQQRRKLARHAGKVALDGVSDKLCLVVLDILHQGRARYATIQEALWAADPFDSLLALGSGSYRERVSTLRAEIRRLEEQGRVGRRVYSRAAQDFVDAGGA